MVNRMIDLRAVRMRSRVRLDRHRHFPSLNLRIASTEASSTATRKIVTKAAVKLDFSLTVAIIAYSLNRPLLESTPSTVLLLYCIWEKTMKYWKASRRIVREGVRAISIKLRSPIVCRDSRK